jgi:UDP-glucose 4-epimerase
MAKAIVTGGAGFIGSNLVDALIEKGHRVTIIDDLSTGRKENLNPEARFHQVDIRSAVIDKIFEQEKPDYLFHLAAQMNVRASVEDPKFDADVNIRGGINLLQSANKHDVKKVIFASTGGAIYGEQDSFPADEEHPARPVSPYGVSKLSFEKYLHYYQVEHGLEYVALRYANVYGPRQSHLGEAGVVAIFYDRLLSGKDAVINGDGKQTRDYVYVGDVIRVNLAAMGYDRSDLFNIGTGVETDVNEIFQKVRKLSGSNQEEKHGPAKPGEQKRSVITYDKAQKELGWQPEIGLKQGLSLTGEYFKRLHGKQ